ncbi:hypothetical protein DL95DRAFT_384597 [Leptodontidium sp. 2 PMI_412]|nr:hypothetical protein DL95DRAFT_384597 [Leptodontidium sp. 2 PMI_412]
MDLRDRAIAGEKIENFGGIFFPATDKSRTIRFMGIRIQIYEKTTKKMYVEKDGVSEETDFEVPSGHDCEVFGGNGSSTKFQ